ncbi:MAG: hypothetical protein SGI73_14220 [Chloroflexota bacterium]|nr:hypothetical protein [Chloroflexota bacterium]
MNNRPKPTEPKQPLEDSRLHQILVATNRLQDIPDRQVFASMAFNAAAVFLLWSSRGLEQALPVAGLTLLGSVAGWMIVNELPRANLSFGPDKPSALALSVLIALIALMGSALGVDSFAVAIPISLVLALAFYATHMEPFRLGVSEEALTVKGWDAAAPPVKLLHIGDIHVERVTPREQRLNALIEAIQPDIIVFSGDFVNLSYTNDETAKQAIRDIVGAWRAPLGVYGVPGTPIVEPLPRVLAFVDGLNMQLLANRWVTVETAAGLLHLLGMITTHDMATDRAALAEKLKLTPSAPGLRMLLMHTPDVAPEAGASGQIDLYVCGHTHGGQIRLPLIGAPFSSSHLGSRFIMGRYRVDDLTLYTTRGVGMEGLGAPRARLLCPPEIVLWTLRGE